MSATDIYFVSINCLGDLIYGPETRENCQAVVDEDPDGYTLEPASRVREFLDDDQIVAAWPGLAEKLGITFA
jgi:hypothetical protein